MTKSTMTAYEYSQGWSVEDSDGGIWWPSDEAKAEIEQSDDPESAAEIMCRTEPTRGEWSC